MAWTNQPINHRACPDVIKEHCGASYDAIEVYNVEIPDERLQAIDSAQIQDLADSIREFGQIAPIGVWMITDPNARYRYRIIYGVKRAKAMLELYNKAMEGCDNPRDNPDAFRYSRLHALVYPESIEGDYAKEMEIRENLDRFELTPEQRKAQTAQLGLILRKRKSQDKPKGRKSSKKSINTSSNGSKADSTQTAQYTQLQQRHGAANADGGSRQDGETDPGYYVPDPEERQFTMDGRKTRELAHELAEKTHTSDRTIARIFHAIGEAVGIKDLTLDMSSEEDLERAVKHAEEVAFKAAQAAAKKAAKAAESKKPANNKPPRFEVRRCDDMSIMAERLGRNLRDHLHMSDDEVRELAMTFYDQEVGL